MYEGRDYQHNQLNGKLIILNANSIVFFEEIKTNAHAIVEKG